MSLSHIKIDVHVFAVPTRTPHSLAVSHLLNCPTDIMHNLNPSCHLTTKSHLSHYFNSVLHATSGCWWYQSGTNLIICFMIRTHGSNQYVILLTKKATWFVFYWR